MGGNTVMDPRSGLKEEEEGGRERGRWAEEETQENKATNAKRIWRD